MMRQRNWQNKRKKSELCAKCGNAMVVFTVRND